MDRTFFVAGGTLDAAAPSYVVRESDEELFQALRAGDYCYVLTPRQTGKSSMMVRAATRLREEGVTAAALDLTASGQNLTPEQWYTGLLDSLARQCGCVEELEDYWTAHGQWGPAQRWVNAIVDVCLPRCPQGLVLFVDEIDFVRSLPFPTDEFFAAIRECHNRRATDPRLNLLTFCLLGVATPADLIRDPRATPFNVGRRIDLADFTASEAQSLVDGLSAATHGPAGGKAALRVLQRVLFWTNGHPYLTQRLCFELVNKGRGDAGVTLTPRAVDELCRELFFSPAAQRQDINLLSVRDRLLMEEQEGDRPALLDLYGRVLAGNSVSDDETNRLVGLLRLSGAVVAVERRLRVRNRIYARLFDRDWVRRHMPDAELQRQRRAVRLALLRATAVASLVVGSLGTLAAVALASESRATSLAKSRGVVIQERDQALQGLKRALLKAQQQTARANREEATAKRERSRAVSAASAKEVQRQLAERRSLEALRARKEAVKQQRLATQRGELSRQRLTRLHLAEGWRMAEQGDTFGSLAHFEAALTLDAGHRERERLHRLRLSTMLASAPRVRQVWRHPAPLNFADYRGDGKRIVVIGDDHVARVGVEDGGWASPPLGSPVKGEGILGWAAFDPDGAAVRIAFDGRETRWLQGGRFEALRLPRREEWLANSPGGEFRLCASGATLRLYRATDRTLLAEAKANSPVVRRLIFSANGRRAASIHHDGAIRVWSIPDLVPACPPLRHSGTILCASFDAAGDRLVSGSEDRSARVWDVRTGRPVAPALPHVSSVLGVCFNPEGTRVATAAVDGTARVWETGTGRAATPLLVHGLSVNSVRFSPDGASVVTASSDRTARVWDAATGRLMSGMLSHSGPVMTAVFHPDGNRILTACADGLAREWELTVVDPAPPTGTPPPATLSLSPLMLGSAAPVQRLAGEPISRPALVIEHRGKMWYVRLPDGRRGPDLRGNRVIRGDLTRDGLRLVTTHADGTARVWNSLSGKPVSPPVRHGLAVHLARFSPDGRWIVTSSLDGTTRVWNAATGLPRTASMMQPETVHLAAFNEDATLLATATLSTLRLWDAATGEPLSQPLQRHHAPTELAFHGNSVWLKDDSGAWCCWDLPTLTWSPSRISRLVAFLAGRPVEGSRRPATTSSADLMGSWRDLRQDYQRTWSVTGSDLLRWHETQARERERGGQWRAAAFHLGKILEARPEAREVRIRRGKALAEVGAWAEAASEFAAADPGGASDTIADQHLLGYCRALCLLAAGNSAGYRKTSEVLLERYRRLNGDRGIDIATWTCALAADSPAEAALALSRELTRRHPEHAGMAQTLGALQLRAGRLAEARDTLLDVIRRRGNGGEAMDHLFLALTFHRLKSKGEAQRHLELAERELREMESSELLEERVAWATRLELRLLWQEAVSLIRPEKAL